MVKRWLTKVLLITGIILLFNKIYSQYIANGKRAAIDVLKFGFIFNVI